MRAQQLHPVHPVAGVGSFVPRLGHGQQRLLPVFARAGVTTTASPLHFMAHNRELSLFAFAPKSPMGLVLDPLTHHRQLPRSHRGAAYRQQRFGNGPAFRPESDSIDLARLLFLAEQPLDAQRAYGATLLLTTYHLVGGVGTRGRDLDLRIARASAAHFKAERMDAPAEHSAINVPRQLFATVAVGRGVVSSPRQVEALAAAYADLDVDGYWVKIEGFSERGATRELEGGAALLGALSDTGRSVVACGAGALHIALLVSDISSSVGVGESERFSMPAADRPRRQGPRPRCAYHPAFFRSFQTTGAPGKRAFATVPCRCGLHPKDRPPLRGHADEHTAVVRAREAAAAAEGSREERREWLRATAAMASHVAHDAGVDVIPYTTLEAVLDGVDTGRDELVRAG